MKKEVLLVFCIYIILSMFLISAVSVADNIPIQIQTTDASGNIVTGTFELTINISNSSTCSPVLYSNTTTKTTDVRGIVSYNLENVNLGFDEQYWFCYYRDSVLKETIKIARTPYAFRAKNITLSGVEVNSNFNLSNYNFTTLGRVGIGTASPSTRLEVNGAIWATTGHLISANPLTGHGVINFGNSTNGNLYFRKNNVVGNVSSFTELMIIKNNGNVGIGTASPVKKLHLHTAADAETIMKVTNSITGTAGAVGLQMGLEASEGAQIWQNENNFLRFGTNNAERMRILAGGNVGIGTTTPQNKLNVIGDINFTGLIYGNGSQLTGISGGGSPAGTEGAIQFYDGGSFGGNASQFFINKTSGNVGIGTDNPGARLHVAGSVTPYLLFANIATDRVGIGTNNPTYTLSVPNGEICEATAGTSACVSDIRLKENIKPINNAIDMLMKLNPVEFTFKNTGENSAGLIAQDVEKVYPEWVILREDGYKTYNNPGFAFYLIKAIQEQQIQIKELKVEKDSEIQKFQLEIDVMKQALCEIGRKEFC